MATVAILGLGRMGSGMARRLLETGHTVQVFNRNPERAQALRGAGARFCRTAREAGTGASAIISIVSDDVASRAVWLGADGALAAAAPETIAIECSTLSHDWVLELAAASSERGLRYIDAPVTGLPDAAASGELTLLVGARPVDLAAARPVLSALSTRIIHFGQPGAGTAYKLLVNMLGAVQIASLAEAMALGERAGLDPKLLAEAIGVGQAASPQVIRNSVRMASNAHGESVIFTPALRLKDVEYALSLARRLGIGAPFGTVAAESFRMLCESGRAQANESAIIEVARRRRSNPT